MIRNTQTTMNVTDEKWAKIFGKKSSQSTTIIDNQLQGNSEEFTLTSDQKKEIKERAKQTMLLKDVGDVR